jgi:hypothetical protein
VKGFLCYWFFISLFLYSVPVLWITVCVGKKWWLWEEMMVCGGVAAAQACKVESFFGFNL